MNSLEWSSNSLVHHQRRRGAHADARIQDVDAAVNLGAETMELRGSVHACDD
ncbi:hypothetical protein [Mycolicibacterium gadium]|uniref:hypothetical protein n=1 Tax=Mycolicibacterium gadium TaxID=1794 RepID=UPI0027E2711E|nr:hypothetical protein [Mycolicibacterium gadium]